MSKYCPVSRWETTKQLPLPEVKSVLDLDIYSLCVHYTDAYRKFPDHFWVFLDNSVIHHVSLDMDYLTCKQELQFFRRDMVVNKAGMIDMYDLCIS